MSQYSAARRITVCGLPATQFRLDHEIECLDVATWDDPFASLPGNTRTTACFQFMLGDFEYANAHKLFPIGEGQMATRSLGPSDVCQYCGAAWLPGTLVCPSCGGETNHFTQAIEYEATNAGIITRKSIEAPFDGVLLLDVEVEFWQFVQDAPYETMFAHGLWRNAPALWVCRFCGYVVKGQTSDCPGCGGKRYQVKELATQKRVCVYCGRECYGNYACPACNERLLAVDSWRHEMTATL